MSDESNVPDIPEGVELVTIEEQKIFDGSAFPLVLIPADGFKDRDSKFWNEWVEKNIKVIENLLLGHGAILFRGFPLETPTEFDEFSKAYGYDPFLNVVGGGVRFNIVGNVHTSGETPPSYVIPFHHELAHLNDFPTVLFFYCDVPAKDGGNTPLALSNLIYRKMVERDPDFVSRLKKEGLRYSRVAPAENDAGNSYGRSWKSTCSTTDKEEAERNIKALGFDFEWVEDGAMRITTESLPAIRIDKRTGKTMWFNSVFPYYVLSQYEFDKNRWRVTFPNGDAIRDESMEILKQVMDEVRVSVKWQRTDVIMVDNRIAMHAKDAFLSPPRSILISFFKDRHGPI